ncbi:MAG: glucosaminidase domain-containing protein, partial [Bacteroidales bacterium]|nr:glucosaminidase domain-containing protein [Bacteroidales bacterium]
MSLFSCRTSRQVSSPAVISGTASTYIQSYKDLAVSEMKRTGVPASITLAQGMLESDYGRSTLARMANNHFGIKCHNDWKGQTVRQHDDRRNECFRKYRKVEDSFYDHSDFLRSGSRYSFLFDLDPRNYKAWAHGLKKAGYATNPDYANLLIKKIEENKLYLFDDSYTASTGRPRQKIPEKEP